MAQAVARGKQVGVGYAVWAGLSTALVVLTGALALHEPVTAAKVTGVALVVASVVTLNLAGAH